MVIGLCLAEGARNVSDVSAKPPESDVLPARKSGKRLRVLGLVLLLLGLGAAGAVYGIRTHASGLTEDQWEAANARAEARQMGILYGKLGVLTHELFDDLKQPGTQAGLIGAASILVAMGCFYAARLADEDDEAC